MQAIGPRCYVTAVQEGSDAQTKGLKRGDLVVSINDRELFRDDLWAINYAHRVLAPRPILPMVVQSPGEEARRIELAATIRARKVIRRSDSPFDLGDQIREFEDEAYLARHRFQEIDQSLLIWKMPEFNLTSDDVRNLMSRIRKVHALVIDLRGNGGG